MSTYSFLYYSNIFVYDLILQKSFLNFFKIPKIKKIYLNLGLKGKNIENQKNIAFLYLILKILTNQKPRITKSKKNNISFKIKKGMIIGCSITLQKKNLHIFLDKLFFTIFLKKEKINFSSKNHFLNFQINDFFEFLEFENEFDKFSNFSSLDVSLHTTCQNLKEHLLLFKNFQYPI